MQPPAEMVHWLFATGLLLLGLCLVCEGIVGEEVWRMRPWRIYLWPGLVFVMGVLMWPVMAFYTNSAIHMYAHGSWAEVLMLAGGAELGLVHGRLKSRWWQLTMPFAFVVTRHRVPRPRAEHVVLRALGVPAPPARLDVPDRGRLPARDRVLAAVAGVPHRRSRSRSSCSPRCSSPTATWRRSSAICRPLPGCRTDETRCARRHRAARAALPGGGLGARDAAVDDRRASRTELQAGPHTIRLHFDQEVRISRGRSRCWTRTARTSRAPSASRRPTSSRRCARSRAAPTRCAGMRSRPTRTSSPASGRSASRVPAPRRRRGLRRRRADDDRARRALAVVPRARAHDRLARLPADLPARARRAAGARAAASPSPPASASSSRSRSGSPRSRCAPRTRCSSRSGSSSTATCRR